MKALIIAAGRGKRLDFYTSNNPKTLIMVGKNTIYENLITHLKSLGINDIATIVGYKKESFKNFQGIKFYENNDWENNNILHSLFYGKEFMNDDILISYGDIWFDKEPIKRLLEAQGDIVLGVDMEWEGYYKNRTEHPISQAENVHYDDKLKVKKIGKHIYKPEDKSSNLGEFMGLMKISKNVIKKFVKEFELLEQSLDPNEKFQNASSFKQSYLTDFIQYLVNKKSNDFNIVCSINNGGWYEIDTKQDYDNIIKRIGNE